MELEIRDLADHEELVPELAAWFHKEWGGRWETATLEGFMERLRGRMNRDQPPSTLVGFLGNQAVGTAAIKIREMETHPQHEFWMGSVFTHEDYRGRGIASELIRAIINKANQFEIDSLYLYTRGKEPLYATFGWKVIETPVYRGKVVSVMERRKAD